MADWKPMNEAAELLGIHRNTLWRWAKAKRIKTRAQRVGGSNMLQKLVDVASIQKIIGGEKLKPGPRPKPE